MVWMNGSRNSLLGLVFLGMGISTGIAQSNPASCLTDDLHRHLQTEFPDGVPGRNPMVVAKAEYKHSFVVPVVVHVLHENGPESNVSLAQIQSQIDVLNEDYNRLGNGANTHPDGADVQITFCLASVDPDGNAHPGYDYTYFQGAANVNPYEADTVMKRMTGWDPNRYLNIWTVRSINGGQIKGYAYFPDEVAGTWYDGVVIDHKRFGRGAGTALNTGNGRVATHEIGHYLGLLHPWGLISSSCFSSGDKCDDTPSVLDAEYSTFPGCPNPLACDGFTPRQIENYMDYSDDRCMNMFSICQADKMRSAIVNYRGKLVGADNLAASGCIESSEGLEAEAGFYLYPNPADVNMFAMYASGASTTNARSYRILDTYGRIIREGSFAASGAVPITIDASTLADGVYILELTVDNDEVMRKKFVVAH